MAADEASSSTYSSTSHLLSSLHNERERKLARSSIGTCTDLTLSWPPLSTIITEETDLTDISLAGTKGTSITIKFKNGNCYKGTIVNGLLNGKGRYVWADGTIYEGDFIMNSITGHGTYHWTDNSWYEGEVKEGYRHGYGAFHSGQLMYTGQWVKGKRQGKGKVEYGSGAYYDGEWFDDKENGRGTRLYSSGNMYNGEWKDRLRHGRGTMHWKEEGERYTGDWVNGIQHGNGTHIWIVGHIDNSQYPVYNSYSGDWNNGIREGWGTFHYACGAVFEGVWINNKKNGKGKYTTPNGDKIEGTFYDDKLTTSNKTREENLPLRPNTPLSNAIGDIDGVEKGRTEQFKLCVSSLISESCTDINYEMTEVHTVILRYLTQLRRIYHKYSTLGTAPHCNNCGHMLNRLQLWQFLRDCQLYRHGLTVAQVDEIIKPCQGGENPSGVDEDSLIITDRYLMREFLQCLFFISYHIYHQESVQLSKCFDSFMRNDCLPRACDIQGQYFSSSSILDKYTESLWSLYKGMRDDTNTPTLRDLLFFIKDSTSDVRLDSQLIVSGIVSLQPLAIADDDDDDDLIYNMELPVVFLEFLEAIVHFSFEWHSEKQNKKKEMKIEEKSVKNELTRASAEAEVFSEDKNETEREENEVEKEVEKEVKNEVEKEVKKEVKKEVEKEIKKEVKKEVEKEVEKEVKKEVVEEEERAKENVEKSTSSFHSMLFREDVHVDVVQESGAIIEEFVKQRLQLK